MQLYLVGLHQVSINYRPRVKFDSSSGVRSFTRAYNYFVKSMEILLSLTRWSANFSHVQGSYVQNQFVMVVSFICCAQVSDTGSSRLCLLYHLGRLLSFPINWLSFFFLIHILKCLDISAHTYSFNLCKAISSLYNPVEEGFYETVFPTTFFPSNWLFFHITMVQTIESCERGMNPVTMTIRENTGRAVNQTSSLLFSSSVSYQLSYTGSAPQLQSLYSCQR